MGGFSSLLLVVEYCVHFFYNESVDSLLFIQKSARVCFECPQQNNKDIELDSLCSIAQRFQLNGFYSTFSIKAIFKCCLER